MSLPSNGAAAFRVEFLRVGRDRKSWAAVVPSLSDASLVREIKQNRALASRGIEFDWDEDGKGRGDLGRWRPYGGSGSSAERSETTMRVNVYAEEMTDRIEIVEKEAEGQKFTGVRFYLELPVTVRGPDGPTNYRGPFLHGPGDDDSAAVTFWGKRNLRALLLKALAVLDEHYRVESNRITREARTDV